MADVTETVGNTLKTGAKSAKSVPPYVWLIAVGGGVLVAFYFNKSKNKASDGTDTQAPSALVYTGTGQTDDSADSNSSKTTGFQTNEAWAQAAKNWLIAQGVDGKEASDAVDLYVNAQALSAKQNAMISNVIRGIGSPPQSLPPTTGTPPPDNPQNTQHDVWGTTPRQNTASLVGTYYTVNSGDTLTSIAKKAFGLASSDYSSMSFASNQILNANHETITDASHLTPGTKLYIPVLSSQEFPGFGQYVPQFGYTAAPGAAKSTGEWQIDTGQIPQSANISRSGAKRQS